LIGELGLVDVPIHMTRNAIGAKRVESGSDNHSDRSGVAFERGTSAAWWGTDPNGSSTTSAQVLIRIEADDDLHGAFLQLARRDCVTLANERRSAHESGRSS
jgi:hypothetical protein